MNERLYYIDWLRVIAFALLIFYHSAVGFFPNDFWLITSPHTSGTLELWMEHSRVWRLSLLFFVSGVGTYFAYRNRHDFDFLRSRLIRLLIPLLFAMAVICVPQVWYERMLIDGYQGGLLEFWTERYFTEGKYPQGHITWAHMWFVGYLLTITCVFFPIMKLLDSRFGQSIHGLFQEIMKTRAMYLLFVVPLLLNLALSSWFPKASNALYNDLAWFSVYISWFALGYLVAANHALVIESLVDRKREIFLITVLLSVLMYVIFWVDSFGLDLGNFANMTALYKTYAMFVSLMMIYSLSILSYQYLNFKHAIITYANKAVFTLYIIHQTIIVALLYYTIKFELGFVVSLFVVFIGTIVFSLAFYHFVVRGNGLIGLFFGQGLQKSERQRDHAQHSFTSAK